MAVSIQEWAEQRRELVNNALGPLAPYPGGKWRYRHDIVDRFPFRERPFDLLLVAFGGMLSDLCATPLGFARHEIVFELTRAHINFLKVLQDDEVREEGLASLCAQMLSYLEPIPVSSEDFYEFLRAKFKDEGEWNKLPRAKRAAYWYLLQWWRFPSAWSGPEGRDSGTFAGGVRPYSERPTLISHGHFSAEDLRWYSKRLKDVQFYNVNSLKKLPAYLEKPDVLCVMDPPFPGKGKGKYMGQEAPKLGFFRELAELLPTRQERIKDGKAWWLMTLKPTPEVAEVFEERFGSDLYVDELGSIFKIGSKTDAPSGELVYANYDASPRTEWRHYEPRDPLQQQLTFETT